MTAAVTVPKEERMSGVGQKLIALLWSFYPFISCLAECSGCVGRGKIEP